MRHLKDHEISLLALVLLQSAARWIELGNSLKSKAPRVAETLHRQAAHARELSDDIINANGVALL
jgi:hypothetical protein